MRVLILDYGVGNLFSLKSAIEKESATPSISSELPRRENFDALILPGVGNFTPVAQQLNRTRDQIHRLVETGFPILGICLGMQILFNQSEEGPGNGLNLLGGNVVRLPSSVKVPHIGWNNLRLERSSRLTRNVQDNSWVYFVHSYYPVPGDHKVVIASAHYGVSFPAIIADRNLFGTQFHPEKSGPAGRRILKNFLTIASDAWKS